MKHYYIIVYQSKVNERILRRIAHLSRHILIHWFDKETDTLLSFIKISKKKQGIWGTNLIKEYEK